MMMTNDFCQMVRNWQYLSMLLSKKANDFDLFFTTFQEKILKLSPDFSYTLRK